MYPCKLASTVNSPSAGDILGPIKSVIDEICSDQSVFMASNDIRLSHVKRRADAIMLLRTVKQDLNTLSRFVDNKLDILISLYSHECSTMNKFIHARQDDCALAFPSRQESLRGNSPMSASTVSASPMTSASAFASSTMSVAIADASTFTNTIMEYPNEQIDSTVGRKLHTTPPGLSSLVDRPCALLYDTPSATTQTIMITQALGLNATIISQPNHMTEENRIYYIPQSGQFIFKLFGHTFHGNIGNIYTSETYTPEKIKDCKFGANCTKGSKCDYYHDPLKFATSRDVRNFIATSWLYSPHQRGGRVFGSRQNLDLDILKVTPEDMTRLRDQITHDMLCLLLLWSAMGEPAET